MSKKHVKSKSSQQMRKSKAISSFRLSKDFNF